MPNMYLVCGISGSGKTYFSKQLEEKLNIERISVDDIYRQLNGDELIRTNKFEVWISLFQEIHRLEIAEKDVIIDTNALKHSHRVQFVDWFPSYNHHLIFVSADHDLRMRNIENRLRKIDESTIQYMESIVEVPTKELDKEWDTITYINNSHNVFQKPIFEKDRLDVF